MNGNYIACDLGAESGRVILGTLREQKLTLEEIHRFPNGPVRLLGTLRWNILSLFTEIKKGLGMVAAKGVPTTSVAVDSWGVDYVYFRKDVPLLDQPYHYRDPRNDKAFAEVLGRIKKEEIFDQTGIQFMPFNTIYQLFEDLGSRPEVVRLAERFLNIADYITFLLSGRDVAERSLASTTQIYDPRSRTWSKKLIKSLGLRESLFPEIVNSGTVLGSILPDVAVETGLPLDLAVVAAPTHDTASAVVAVPAEGDDWAFLSSGTWSLLGVELPAPVITPEAFKANFTNEVGHGNTIRFLKNITGLWILQECRRKWAASRTDISYAELVDLATAVEPFRCLINPEDPRFAKPGDMPSRIQEMCRETGQPIPETPGEFVRTILDSLALLYSVSIRRLESISGRSISRLHIVGGGSQNTMLNQLTADACGITVIAGPVEGTAIGNVLVQAMACGAVADIATARQIVRDSFPVTTFAPSAQGISTEVRERFSTLTQAV